MVDPATVQAQRSDRPAQPGHRDRSDPRFFYFRAERAGSSDVGHVTSRPPLGPPGGRSRSLVEPAGLSACEPITFLAS